MRCAVAALSFLVVVGCAPRAAVPVPVTSPPPAGPLTSVHAALAQRLDAYLRGQVKREFSGVVLVARGDSLVLHEAYSTDTTITPETAFWIGSLTKPFVAAAILQLAGALPRPSWPSSA